MIPIVMIISREHASYDKWKKNGIEVANTKSFIFL
jgi:hypothetical protein